MRKFDPESLCSNEPRLLAYGRLLDRPKRKGRPIYVDGSLNNIHLLATGTSGCGKTRFLYSLVKQHIDRHEGVIVIDPHGDLHENLLSYMARKVFGDGRPNQRQIDELGHRLIIVEPAKCKEFGSVGINVLQPLYNQDPYEVVDELVSVFASIWRSSWGDRMADIMRNSFRTLQDLNLTLAELPRLLTDKAFRVHLASKLRDQDVKLYWQHHFHGFRDSEQRYFVESTRNKISAFISNPYIRPILSVTESTLDFRDMINKGKVCLINLSRNHIKTESRRLLGSLLFARLHMAIISREDIPEDKRRPIYIYVDEAHEVFNRDSFLPILEGGRKYAAFLHLFHQVLSQFEREDVDIILGNTGIRACFNVGRADAERMAKELFSPTGDKVKSQKKDFWGPIGEPRYWSIGEEFEHYISEITSQMERECIIGIKGDRKAKGMPYVCTIGEVSYPRSDPHKKDILRRHSATRYARPVTEIEREARRRMDEIENEMTGAGGGYAE